MRFRIPILLLLSTFYSLVSSSQDKSNRGKEFWLAYGFDYSFFNETPVNNQELAIYISTDQQAATVTVTITNTGYTQTLNIPANTADASILIPKSGPNDARTLTDGLQNKGIHIVSDVPVAVYAHVYSTQVSGATMLMPVETYGYLYHSINYYQTTSQSNPGDWYSWFYAIASEDNTRLDITPSDTTKNGWLPGQTYTVNLNRGESYHVFGKAVFNVNPAYASKDMTGSKVISVPGADGNCHPVAVFSGSGGIRLCRGDGGEFMHQQVFPAQAWGTRYLTYHTINNTSTDILQTNRSYYRVCVQDPTTVVTRNGVALTGLIKNFFYEFMDSTGGDYIESDKPILVAQYMVNKNQCWNFPTTSPSPPSYGDPEMFYLSPIEQGQKSVLFYTSRKSSIDYVYANIHLPTAAVGSLRVDGLALPASQIIPHPNYPSYSVALTRFIGPAAQHSISSDSTFTATVYGLGSYESYGYNVGTLINNLNSYSSIQNTLNTNGTVDTFTCPRTPVRLYAKIAFPAVSIHWKLSQVTGMTPNVDSIINNPVPVSTQLINNRIYYIYTLQQDFTFATPGTYIIPISYTAAVVQNCNQTENATVKVVVKPGPAADFVIANQACLSDTVRLTGNTPVSVFNYTGYLWNFDDATTQNTINASKKFAIGGNHNVRYLVYADNGCIGDTTKTVTLLPSPVSKIGVTAAICTGDSVLVSDTSSIAAGSITSWQYYFGDATSITRNTSTPFYHTYSLQGTYIIKLITTSNNGCKSDTGYSIPVTVLDKPILNLGNDITTCGGNPIVLNATTANSTYLWQDGSTNPTLSATTSGLYWAEVRNAGGCTKRDSINISFTASPVFNLGADAPVCAGDSLTLNATATGAISYLWSTGAATPTIKAFQAGIYWCEVSNGGCIFRDSLTITAVMPKPIVNLGNDITTCATASILLDATNPNATYLWQNGSTNATLSASTSGLYWAEVRNAAGCIKRDSINITFRTSPVFNLGADAPICAGDAVTLNATVTGAISYLWSTGATTPTINTSLAGVYWCEVNNGGCTFRDSLTVTAVIPKPVVNLGNDITQCGTNPITLNATNPNATYLWQDGSINPTLLATATGLYWVEVRNVGGCTKRDSINITFNPFPVFNLGADTPICFGDSLTMNAAVTGATSYLWSTGATTSTLKANQAGLYWCEVSKTGCIFRDSLTITNIKPLPVVNLGNDVAVCEGLLVPLDATYLNSTYTWQDGSTNPVYSVSQPGTYRVQVDYNGCKKSDTVIVNYNPRPRFSLGPDQLICQGNSITLTPVLNTIWQLGWQDGTVSPTYTVTQPGLYSLSATNNCGTTTDDIVFIKGLCTVFAPTAFTPNNDGKNDLFKALGTEAVTEFNLKIFNRTGQVVFETSDKSKGWDGKLSGTSLSTAVFVYLIKYKDIYSADFKILKGTFTLIR